MFSLADTIVKGFVVATIILAVSVGFLTPFYIVSGPSMQPTLDPGDRFVGVNYDVLKQLPWYGEDDIGHGTLVTIKAGIKDVPDRVKRVVAVSGDMVLIRGGTLYVNGQAQNYTDTFTQTGSVEFPLVLQEGEYFVLGDNRPNSNDSRYWGAVKSSEISSIVWAVVWPLSKLDLT